MLRYSKFEFCPKCGENKLSVFQKNAMECRVCGYVYFHNCASAVTAIIETKQGILLARRNHSPKKGGLDLPGGFSDYHESLESAVAREVSEELSLELSSVKYFGSFPNEYKFKNVLYFTIDAIFICKPSNIATLRANDELSEILFVKPHSIDLSQIAFVSARNALREYCRTK